MSTQIADSFVLKWPEHLKELFLDTYIKTNIEQYLKTFIPNYIARQTFPEIVEEGTSFAYEGEEKKLEHTLVFLYDSNKKVKHVVLIFDQRLVFERGFEREVKKCYDLVKGKFRVEKPVLKKEQTLLERFQGIEGIPKSYGFFKRFNPRTGKNQTFTIEKYYEDGNLEKVLLTKVLTTSQKLGMIHSSLSALKTLHSNSDLHLDIKLENITVGKCLTVLNDYGNLNIIDQGIGPWLYSPPEYFDFLRKTKFSSPTSEQFIKYHTHFGQARDVWALGIVFLCIINSSSLSEKFYLNFLKNAFEPAFVSTNDRKPFFPKKVFHSRESLQGELKNLVNSIIDIPLLKVLRIVEKMLDFDPDKRISAAKAFEEIDQIIQFNPSKSFDRVIS